MTAPTFDSRFHTTPGASFEPGPHDYTIGSTLEQGSMMRGVGGSFGASERPVLKKASKWVSSTPGPGSFSDFATSMGERSLRRPAVCSYEGDDTLGYHPDMRYTLAEESWDPDVPSELLDEDKQYRGLYSSQSCKSLRTAVKQGHSEGELRRLLPPFGMSGAERVKAWGFPTDTSNVYGESYNSHQPMEELKKIAPKTSASTFGTQTRMNIIEFTQKCGAGPNYVDTPGVGAYDISKPIAPVVQPREKTMFETRIVGPHELRVKAKQRLRQKWHEEMTLAQSLSPDGYKASSDVHQGVGIRKLLQARQRRQQEEEKLKRRAQSAGPGFLTSEPKQHFVEYLARNGECPHPSSTPGCGHYTPNADTSLLIRSHNLRTSESVAALGRPKSWARLSTKFNSTQKSTRDENNSSNSDGNTTQEGGVELTPLQLLQRRLERPPVPKPAFSDTLNRTLSQSTLKQQRPSSSPGIINSTRAPTGQLPLSPARTPGPLLSSPSKRQSTKVTTLSQATTGSEYSTNEFEGSARGEQQSEVDGGGYSDEEFTAPDESNNTVPKASQHVRHASSVSDAYSSQFQNSASTPPRGKPPISQRGAKTKNGTAGTVTGVRGHGSVSSQYSSDFGGQSSILSDGGKASSIRTSSVRSVASNRQSGSNATRSVQSVQSSGTNAKSGGSVVKSGSVVSEIVSASQSQQRSVRSGSTRNAGSVVSESSVKSRRTAGTKPGSSVKSGSQVGTEYTPVDSQAKSTVEGGYDDGEFESDVPEGSVGIGGASGLGSVAEVDAVVQDGSAGGVGTDYSEFHASDGVGTHVTNVQSSQYSDEFAAKPSQSSVNTYSEVNDDHDDGGGDGDAVEDDYGDSFDGQPQRSNSVASEYSDANLNGNVYQGSTVGSEIDEDV